MIVDDPDDGGSDSTSNRLLALIGSGIISGDLAPGEKLTEVGLAKRYGVSRAPLREALLRLEERQLIERMPFSGTRVAAPPAPPAPRAPRKVRPACAATAQIEELHAAVEEGARSARDAKPTSPRTGSPTPHRFHNKIAEIGGSLELARLLGREIWRFSIQIHRKWNRSPERLQASIREHEHILAAIEAADEELAEMVMRRHIAAAYKGQQA